RIPSECNRECKLRSTRRCDPAGAAPVSHFHRQDVAQLQATECPHESRAGSTTTRPQQPHRRLIAENRVDWAADQNFDGETFPFVFVRRLLPLKLFGVNLANALDKFYSCHERAKSFTVNYMQLG